MRWYLNRTGQPEGPFEEHTLTRWIRDGALAAGNVCPEGGKQWMALADHLPFARALRDAATGPTMTPGDLSAAAVAAAMHGRDHPPPPTHQSGQMAAVRPQAQPPVEAAEAPSNPHAIPHTAVPGSAEIVSSKPGAQKSPKLDRTQRLDEADAVSSTWDGLPQGPSAIPPSGELEITRIQAPRGQRTPAKPVEAVDFLGQLPETAPEWMHHAQRMIAGLQSALKEATTNDSTIASIERAWAGWELDGSSERQIARLALLTEQTHTAVRNAPPERLEKSIRDCAEVLRMGIPRPARKNVTVDDVVLVVRQLREEADPWVAVVDATAQLLGWSRAAGAHAAHAVRLAIVHTRKR